MGAHVTVPGIDKRPDRPKPWRVRWIVDGSFHTRSFRTRAEADRFRSTVVAAAGKDGGWDRLTGLPATRDRQKTPPVHEWAREYLAREWGRLVPHSRSSLTWSLARGLEVLTGELASAQRSALRDWLVGTAALPASLERWASSAPLLNELDRRALVRLEDGIIVGVNGERLARGSRELANFRRCLDEAARTGVVGDFDWPPVRPQRRRKKELAAAKPARTVLSEAQAAALLAELTGTYRAMSATALYGGLRPGEVVALEGRDIEFARGLIHVHRAWNGAGHRYGGPDEDLGPTKTSTVRDVPLTSELAAILAEVVAVVGDGPLFRTRSGKRPTQSNWWRALQRAGEKSGVGPVSPYDLRHYFVSHLVLRAPIAEAARIAGHTPAVLIDHYLHAVRDDAPEAGA